MAVALLATGPHASAQVRSGKEFQVNTYTTGTQRYARPAMDPDGNFIVVWSSYPQDGSSNGVFGQRFTATGGRRGGEFLVNTYTTGLQSQPAVAVGPMGDFVVVWTSVQDGLSFSVQGQRFDALGNPTGAEFLVNTFTTGEQFGPGITGASDGGFVVEWSSGWEDGNSYGVAARRFDAAGNPIGTEFVVNTYTTGSQGLGALAVEANGNLVAVWWDNSNRDGRGSAIFGQRYDAMGNRLGSEFQVNTYTWSDQVFPSVSASSRGGFAVAWSSQFGDGSSAAVFARRFDASGGPVGNDFVVNTQTFGRQYSYHEFIAHDARGNFVVTWNSRDDGSGYGVFAQRFNASGVRRGLEFRVNTYTTGDQGFPSVASDSAGNFVITWTSFDQDGSYGGVFAQRFGGLRPFALTVDRHGNQVLEPGEKADVRPTWLNFSGAAQTFSGALTNIDGPQGATYTLTDPTAEYGTVANDATASCAHCYTLSVSSPRTRPALHWDVSVVESILPDTQGHQKEWLLHVGRSFTDVATASPFYPFVETMLHKGVTGGCGGNNYCPSVATTREQMASFALLAKEGAGYTPKACATPMFNDVPASNPSCKYVEELARRGVVSGCGGGNYCPTSAVTRDQMAVFVLRTLDPALNPPACGTPMFGDVPASSPFCKWVEELARRGVVSGCGAGNYCPTAAVTREQMGVFISATFGLTLYGP
jgi:hypothetical protein